MIPGITLISVMYNEAHRVDEWMRNAHAYGVDQIVVVDQSSTDGTDLMLVEYAEVDDRLTVLHDECRGFGEASRPRAWQRAVGPWVLQLDADEHLTDEFAADLRYIDRWPQHRQTIRLEIGGQDFGKQGSIYRFVPQERFTCPADLHTCFMPRENMTPSMGLHLDEYIDIVDSKSWVEALDGEANYRRLGTGPSPQRRGVQVRTPFLNLAEMMGLKGEEIDAMTVEEREHLGFKPGGGLHT